MKVNDLSASVIKLWSEWEVRAMILLSLLLQIFLIITGSRRKYIAGFWFGSCVWLAYLSADWLATVTLGLLARSQGAGSESNGTASTTSNASIIPAFWAPMLLVHLGGPETISAYALEDNELWPRHLLQLITELAVAFYATLRSWWSKDPLIYLVIPIFVCGMIKYGERIWALWLASSNQLRESAKKGRARLLGYPDDQVTNTEEFETYFSLDISPRRNKYLYDAHFLFPNLKLLFADDHMRFFLHMYSYIILRHTSAAEAFKLIEVQLNIMFDILFTKKMTSTVWWRARLILRFINFLSAVSALLAFSLMTSRRNFHAYSESDMIISFMLLVGAIVLEIYSANVTLFSDWAMLWISKQIWEPVGDCLLTLFSNNRRWKASMGQCQLDIIHFEILSWEVVGDDLKELIFNHLLDKRKGFDTHSMDEEDLKNILEQKGGGVLQKKGCLEELGWSASGERDFHETFLLWHIAINDEQLGDSNNYCKMSRSLSRYILYLRKEFPFMLPKELGEGKYKLSSSDYTIASVDAGKLSNSLTRLQISEEDKWEMISEVFVEMLCYAASHCEWKEHARALAQGGELLTFVAVLMAHLGFSQQCRCPKKYGR